MISDGRLRVTIENVQPQVADSDFPVKRSVGEPIVVQADVFADGHDRISANLLYRAPGEKDWRRSVMYPLGNDLWEGTVLLESGGEHYFTVEGYVNKFRTWQADFKKKYDAGQNVAVDLQVGVQLINDAVDRATDDDAAKLKKAAAALDTRELNDDTIELALSSKLADMVEANRDHSLTTRYEKEITVNVERERARFSSWYEFFPRSFGNAPGKHATLKDCEALLPRIAGMGFNVVYLPPIHPIGTTNRKGKNNATTAEPGDVGSPWAIGARAGGHKAVHPDLGTLDDFDHFVGAARELGLEVALDIAFQCSPDHPYVKEHPDWFIWRPDGSIQYAENPPKKYEDVVPFNFETDDWQAMWEELTSVIMHWADHGVTVFRIDNPHTKPFAFWEYAIATVRRTYPEAIFLAEAFTRPKVMKRLAKVGFQQSYTYFTWRNSKWELMDYLVDLSQGEARDYFRPNFWPNTPDILPEFLQFGGRPAFLIRMALAATMSSNWGIYGPAYELCVHKAVAGKEEYLNSEKYEIKDWNLNAPESITGEITTINRIRNENPALQATNNIRFLDIDNDHMIAYAKMSPDLENFILVVVNLDPFHVQSGWIGMPIDDFGIPREQTYMVHDLVSDDRYIWQGEENFVELNPQLLPYHVFKVYRRMRREHDFDYYM